MADVSPTSGTEEKAPLVPSSTEAPKKAADYMLLFYWDKDGTEGPDAEKTLNGDDVIDRVFVHEEEAKVHFKNMYKACKGVKAVKKKDVREACLQDFQVWLPHMGFSVSCFKSIDEDELFMRVSLEEMEVQKFYAEKAKVYLQLSRECVEKIGVKYPEGTPEEFCSPPYLAYEDNLDEGKVKELGCTKTSIFKNHYRLRNPAGSILRHVDSIRIIRRTINRLIDLDDLAALDILSGKYPIHVKAPLEDLRSEWATFQPTKLFNIWAPLPLTRIRNYFGESVAFFFAWLAHTVRSFSILAVLGIAYKLAVLVAPMMGIAHSGFYGQLIFGVVMAGWGTAYSMTWKRQEYYFCVDWNMLDLSDRAVLRPDFVGDMMPNPVNINVKTKLYPENMTLLYKIISNTITIVFLTLAVSCIFATRGLEEVLGPMMEDLGQPPARAATIVSVLISVEIQIFGQIWNRVGRALVRMENPRTDFEYLDLLIWKLAPFTLITTYNTFIWIALFQKYFAENRGAKPCGTDGDCIFYLQTSLLTTFITQGVMIIVGMAIPYIMLWRELKKEADEVEKRMKEKNIAKVPDRCFMEKQAKMGVFDLDAEIGEYMTSVTVIGYVVIFGAAAPAMIAFGLVVLLFQLRACAYKLTKLSRRPYPTLKNGIGSWGQIVDALLWTSLVFYVGIPMLNGEAIEHWDAEWKVVACFAAEHVVVLAKLLLTSVIDLEPADAKLLYQRRQYVKDKLLIGQDDPESLKDDQRKPPLNIEASTCLNAETEEWQLVDRTAKVTLCGGTELIPVLRDLTGDKDMYV